VTCKALCIVIFTLCVATVVQATIKNLGTVGTTYPVIEPDILVELQQQAAQKRQLSKERMLERMRNYQPKQLYKLPHATADKTFLVNMTYTLDRDLADAQGKLIYPRGYTFNPLDYTALPGGIVVIDGDDPRQMKWFKTSPYFKNHQARLLISNGHAFDLVEKLQRPVFYLTDDIARRLQLSAVPSLVIQQGDKMQVREFYLPLDRQGKVNGDQ